MTAVVKQPYDGDKGMLYEEIKVLDHNIKMAKSLMAANQKSKQLLDVLRKVKQKLMCFDTSKRNRDLLVHYLPLLYLQIKNIKGVKKRKDN